MILVPRIAVRFVFDVNVPTYSTAYEISLIKRIWQTNEVIGECLSVGFIAQIGMRLEDELVIAKTAAFL